MESSQIVESVHPTRVVAGYAKQFLAVQGALLEARSQEAVAMRLARVPGATQEQVAAYEREAAQARDLQKRYAERMDAIDRCVEELGENYTAWMRKVLLSVKQEEDARMRLGDN